MTRDDRGEPAQRERNFPVLLSDVFELFADEERDAPANEAFMDRLFGVFANEVRAECVREVSRVHNKYVTGGLSTEQAGERLRRAIASMFSKLDRDGKPKAWSKNAK